MAKPAGNQRGGSTAPGVEEKVSGYIDRLTEFLVQCANDIESRPDAFLWGARRSLEAIVRAVYTKDGATKQNIDMSLGQLLEQFEKKDGLIDRDVLGALRNLQLEGNYGTHLQNHEPMAYDEPVDRCRQSLVHAVKWFFLRSNIGAREMPPEIQAALEVIGKKAPSPVRLERERAEKERVRAAKDRDELRDELAAARRELERAHEEATTLQRKIAEMERARGRARRAGEEPGEGGSRLRRIGRATAPALVAVAVLAVAAGAWVILRSAEPSAAAVGAAPAQISLPVDASDGDADLVPPGDDGGAVVAAIVAIDAGAEPARGCPAGMVQFKGGVTGFGEPHPRPWWTSSKTTGLKATVAPFCLDIVAVSAKGFAPGELESARSSSRFKNSGCRSDKGGGLRNCVTQAEAARYCEGHGARLPRLVEWEHVASLGAEKKLDVSPDSKEWVDDPFPSPAWGRGAPEPCEGEPCYLAREGRLTDAPVGAARYSWMRYPGTRWLGTHTFRCARDL